MELYHEATTGTVLKNPEEVARAEQEEQQLRTEINRLMDRLRAVKGQLMQVRKTGRRFQKAGAECPLRG